MTTDGEGSNTTTEKLYDKKGYPIVPGDVLKVFHYVARIRRERIYMYKLVVEDVERGQLKGMDIGEIAKKGFEKAHTYPLNSGTQILEDTEIVQGYGPGDYINFRDRPRFRS